jgi:putative transposase
MDAQGDRNRHSMRYAGYDYTRPGAYFITICTAGRLHTFGAVVDGLMQPSPLGRVVVSCWAQIPQHYACVSLGEYVMMPNHTHGILWIVDSEQPASVPTPRRFGEPVAGSISTIVATYKAAVTREAREAGIVQQGPIWQGRFWDHIIRDETSLAQIQDYIRTNPLHWEQDQLHPEAPPNRFNR